MTYQEINRLVIRVFSVGKYGKRPLPDKFLYDSGR
jgi:hypothetical protein